METALKLSVNGELKEITTEPDRPLLEVLREDLLLTGTKYGCGEGQCRACTVLLDGQPALSCRLRVGEVAGREVSTIEGLARGGQLHPVQQAFLDEQAFQCGFCTPGMILELTGLLELRPRLVSFEIERRMHTHLCRCCHYPKIHLAIRRAIALTTGNQGGA